MKISCPELSAKDILLRPIVSSDLDQIYQGLSHPDVIRYYGISYKTRSETKAQMEWYQQIREEGSGVWWAIVSKDGNGFYGACGFNNYSEVHRKAEIGFWLLPEYWGRGIMVSSARLICDHAFTKVGIHRIEAVVETANHNSKRVMQKLCFVLEGTQQDAEVKNGRFISLDLYALLNR
ncbi:GNAT family N-acetyltransferase [Niabella yanshanensis]|uniref:GNAT family N-acetyltransferase n=1 Tax=Niabella yanshanensis TaxID=577386 RepID=A0ABZ0W8D9_9BACT|nr:GNAT family N-acetyltransferase [Niabella yanshanensis]WQD39558.1 GNAT family N-acetyltransferase [Niabella yanshanensis]